MTRRAHFYVWLIAALAIAALLSGCETMGFLRERGRPVNVPAHNPNAEPFIACPGHGIFKPCGLSGSEWEGKV